MTIKNKKILIIIGGGIAAYKSLDLIRLLRKSNNEIKTILTKTMDNGDRFDNATADICLAKDFQANINVYTT